MEKVIRASSFKGFARLIVFAQFILLELNKIESKLFNMITLEALNPIPSELKCEDRGLQTIIVRRWYVPSVWITFIFGLFLNAFMFNWYSIALARPATNSIAIWFPVLHVGVGIYFFYTAITGFFNSSYFSIGGGQIDVRHAPFPWLGNKSVDSSQVRQLFCDEVTIGTWQTKIEVSLKCCYGRW